MSGKEILNWQVFDFSVAYGRLAETALNSAEATLLSRLFEIIAPVTGKLQPMAASHHLSRCRTTENGRQPASAPELSVGWSAAGSELFMSSRSSAVVSQQIPAPPGANSKTVSAEMRAVSSYKRFKNYLDSHTTCSQTPAAIGRRPQQHTSPATMRQWRCELDLWPFDLWVNACRASAKCSKFGVHISSRLPL